MRTKTKFRLIRITEQTYQRLAKDRREFQKLIGGGKWGFNDTIIEYIKILETKTRRRKQNE